MLRVAKGGAVTSVAVRKRVLAVLLVTLGLGIVGTPHAVASKVGNAGSGFELKVQNGFLRIKTNSFSFTDEGRQPECSDGQNNGDDDQDVAVDYPADPQCTSESDDSEVAAGFQPKQPILMTNGSIAADGTATFPSTGISFPPEYGYVNADEASGGFVDDFIITITTSPLSNFTGSVNPLTGAMTLYMRIRLDIDGGPLDSNCRIEPIDINSLITGTTSPPGPNSPITGFPYLPATGRATIVNNSFSVPGAQGCGSDFFGAINYNDQINDQFGLPSAAGNNETQLLVEFSPRVQPAIAASFTATPPSGAAPLDVAFDASASTSVRPVSSYQWDFTNNGSFDSSGMTRNFTYPTPGTWTVRLRVTDDQGDFAETTRTITAGVAPPVIRPDALLKLASEEVYFGDNDYGTDGSNQLRVFKVKRGKVLTLDIAAQNDGDTPDSFTITGCGPSRGYKVTYSDGATDVPQAGDPGGFTTQELAPTELEPIQLTIKVKKRAVKAKSCDIAVTSQSDPSVVDVVVARIKPR